MLNAAHRRVVIGSLVVVAIIATSAISLYRVLIRKTPATVEVSATTMRATPTATRPALPATSSSKPASASVLSYMDVVRKAYPSLPATQPLASPLELNQAARLILSDPIYLSPARGDLWITRAEAPPIQAVLKAAIDPDADSQTHLLRERALFVHWMPRDSGPWMPYVVCADADGGAKVCSFEGTTPLPAKRHFDWNRAFSWDDKVVVPSRAGVSVFEFRPQVTESFCDLSSGSTTAPASEPAAINEPQALPDGKGLLVWVPWEHGRGGSRGAFRYLDGKWIALNAAQGWPDKLVQLVPLRDGSVFQFVARDDGSASVETVALDHESVDTQAIEKLVEQLGDVDPEVRHKAYTELSNFGPGAWPEMMKLAENQPPQTQLLLRQLLKDQRRPTLSGMTLLGDRALQLVDRLSDGGVVFYAAQGISIPEADGDPSTTAPAWLSVRPGHFVEPLLPALVMDLKPETGGLDVVGDQWIANSDVRGQRLFFGNGFSTLLRKDEREFSRIVGVDARGRWLFQRPISAANDASAFGAKIQTLILDPHLPDPTPRLPVWQLAIAESVGWDKDGWPVVKNGGAYAITESDWRPLDKDEKFFSRPEDIPIPATTRPATSPTTANADRTGEIPLLIAPDGTRYFDGLTELRVIQLDGKQIDWPLPAVANGTGKVHLVQTSDGKLFLFNQPGRVLRIATTPDGPEPFKLEATFTHNIPYAANPTRIWVDPAGRIIMDADNRLALLFASGFIPRAISEKMLDSDLHDGEAP
jgi:hypothetical protein